MTQPTEVVEVPADAALPTQVASLRERILNANDTTVDTVTVPEWGDAVVQVRSMSARERADLFSGVANGETMDYVKLFPSLVIACAYDPETGEKLFTQADVDALLDKSGSAVERVAKAALKVSGMDAEAEKEAGKDSSSADEPSSTS